MQAPNAEVRDVSTCLAEVRWVVGGERGIRTLGTVAGTPLFESGTFNHSVISPYASYYNR
jgi:hypothetical protein